jgi:hypothetical protein
MTPALQYWTLIGLDATGRCKTEVITSARAFFMQVCSAEMSNADIQSQLLHWLACQTENLDKRQGAELCLRCFISHEIVRTCRLLETQFGISHGFTSQDLLPLVLNDVIEKHPNSSSNYKSFSTVILESFDARLGGLSNWTNKLIKHHPEVHKFLLEHGVYLASDWAILNDTRVAQMSEIFAQFYYLTSTEIQSYSWFLSSYHAVYRRDRLQQRAQKKLGKCLPPTEEQMQRIARNFHLLSNKMLPNSMVMFRLQKMAELLRQYRIYIRGGYIKLPSVDNPKINLNPCIKQPDDEEKIQIDFLKYYRLEFLNCLDKAIEDVIQHRITNLRRQNVEMAQKYLTAIHLFHCHGEAMGNIANQIGLQAQYQVTRLLQLKKLRASVRQVMLNLLLPLILDKVRVLNIPERIKTVDNEIEAALNEEISEMIQAAKSESIRTRNRPLPSLFARRLCIYIDKLIS